MASYFTDRCSSCESPSYLCIGCGRMVCLSCYPGKYWENGATFENWCASCFSDRRTVVIPEVGITTIVLPGWEKTWNQIMENGRIQYVLIAPLRISVPAEMYIDDVPEYIRQLTDKSSRICTFECFWETEWPVEKDVDWYCTHALTQEEDEIIKCGLSNDLTDNQVKDLLMEHRRKTNEERDPYYTHWTWEPSDDSKLFVIVEEDEEDDVTCPTPRFTIRSGANAGAGSGSSAGSAAEYGWY